MLDSSSKHIFFLLVLSAETELLPLLCVFKLPISFCSLAPGNSSPITPAHLASLSTSSSPLSVYLSAPLQELPEKWNNVRKQAALVKQQVAPLQAIEVTSLRRKCASFDVEQHTFRELFHNSGPFRYDKYQLFCVSEHPRFPAVNINKQVNALLHIIV